MTTAINIGNRYKLIFLGASFLGCFSTIFLPYNSIHLKSAPNIPTLHLALNQYCVAIKQKYLNKCGSDDDGAEYNNNNDEEECRILKKDTNDCLNAVIKADHEINLNGCVKYIAIFSACSLKWCNGDETSRDIARGNTDASTSSGDDDNDCSNRCKDKVDMFKDCEDRILKKWFRKYGVKDDFH